MDKVDRSRLDGDVAVCDVRRKALAVWPGLDRRKLSRTLVGEGVTVELGSVKTDERRAFRAELVVPSHVPPGTYELQALGDPATAARLTVTASAVSANPAGRAGGGPSMALANLIFLGHRGLHAGRDGRLRVARRAPRAPATGTVVMIQAGPSSGSAAMVRPTATRATWTAAAVLAFLFLALIYIPTHGALLDPGGLGAAVAILLFLFLSIAVPRVIRGSILVEGGLEQPITAMVRGSATPIDPSVSPRRRAAAIVAGATSSAAIAALAFAISRGQPVTGYPHAIATFVFAANAALAARAIVPVPGLSGWALLLSLVDLRSPDDPQRIVRAARAAKRLSIPATLLVTAFGFAIGAPILTSVALMLGMLVWTQADVAENRDIVDRFLAGRTAGEVAQPLTAFLRADEPVRTPVLAQPVVSMVLGPDGELLGFIGPRQLVQALAREAQPVRWVDSMTPIELTALVSRDVPAPQVKAGMDRHGFVVIRLARGLGYVEAGELARQAHGWATAE